MMRPEDQCAQVSSTSHKLGMAVQNVRYLSGSFTLIKGSAKEQNDIGQKEKAPANSGGASVSVEPAIARLRTAGRLRCSSKAYVIVHG